MGVRRPTWWFLLYALFIAGWAIFAGLCVLAAVYGRHPILRSMAVVYSALLSVVGMAFAWMWMAAPSARFTTIARLFWTLAFLALVVHILIAFDVAHGWSHAAAVEHVRRVGGFGGGIVVNYLFAAVWLADVLWWWISPKGHEKRPCWVGWLIHGFLAFVVVNATVVFGSLERRGLYIIVLTYTLSAILLGAEHRWLQKWRGQTEEPGRRPGSGDASESVANHSPT